MQSQAAYAGVLELLIGASYRKASQENQTDTFSGGTVQFSLHISAYLSNHSLPRSGAFLILHPIALLHQISNTSETNQIKN